MENTHEKSSARSSFFLRLKWSLLLITLGIAVFCAAFFLVSSAEKKNIAAEAEQMLTYLQSICSKYDDYELGNTTKDLQALINKANSLSYYVEAEDYTDQEALMKYVRYQYLTGICILDADGRVYSSVNRDGRSVGSLLRTILTEKNVRDIMEFPKKIYAEQIQVGDRYYNYAIVARTDQEGAIICYCDITDTRGDRYDLSLASLLLDDTFRHDAVTVVTDGMTIEGTNAGELQGLSILDWPITDVTEQDRQQNASQGEDLVRLRVDGDTWYGMYTLYQGHYLYVFYPSGAVFEKRMSYMSYVIIVYGVLGIAALLWIQHRRKEKSRHREKEIQLISAIASIYSANLLLHLRDNSWTAIVASDHLREALQDAETAANMLRSFRNSQVAEEYREGFAIFTDMNTMEGRLRGKNFEGYFFEHVNGNWYQALLIPQQRDEQQSLETVMLVFRDVTAQRKKELDYQEQLREIARDARCANAAKTDFLRRMSHDIRTPINGIRGMADIGLSIEDNPKKARECFTKIIGASNFLLELVNNVLDMSKLESGEIQLEEKPFDLRELIQDTAMSVETQAREQGLKFTMETLDDNAHWHVIGSPLHVRQILQNIMSNAVKYNRENGSIDINCQELSCDGGQAVFEFICADTGIGMSAEFQKHAYELFAQEHKKNKARTTFSGTGLGLSIAKKIADSIGAELSFTSQEGEGTVFVLKLHLQIDEEYTEGGVRKVEAEQSLEGMCILVVEDNELNMEIMEYMLQEKGVTVIKAMNGKVAFELFRASEPWTFDVILMDIMMPVMDGLETTRQIRALNRPDAATVPILAMSANAFTDDIVRSREAGMNEHMSKPLEFHKMMQTIAKYRRKCEN